MRLLGDKVLIRRATEPAKTPGGIILPESVKSVGNGVAVRGEVVEASPFYYDNGVKVELLVKKGDAVLFFPNLVVEVEVSGEKLLLGHEKDVLGVLEA